MSLPDGYRISAVNSGNAVKLKWTTLRDNGNTRKIRAYFPLVSGHSEFPLPSGCSRESILAS